MQKAWNPGLCREGREKTKFPGHSPKRPRTGEENADADSSSDEEPKGWTDLCYKKVKKGFNSLVTLNAGEERGAVQARDPSAGWSPEPLQCAARTREASGNRACSAGGWGPGDWDCACGSGIPRSRSASPRRPYRCRPSGPRPSPPSVRSPGRGPAATEAEGPPPGSQRSGGEGTTCPARAGAGGAGRARLPEPERTPAEAPGPIHTRRRPSRAPASLARVDASSWTARWGPSGRTRVRAGVCAGSADSAHGRGRATDPLWSNEGRDGCSGPRDRSFQWWRRAGGGIQGAGDTQKKVVENGDSEQREAEGTVFLSGY
ncbi:hypothetical protein J1605_007629 [Eschrichtius robustus]|uniref:Uncharacterized protein n=1 Tax=Eschrichtius robustus TaxID=9764 RepID=A0AB34GY81_ESCRO|nr:hypothetical protein J1605_007629 [Eschrichtius robustus]